MLVGVGCGSKSILQVLDWRDERRETLLETSEIKRGFDPVIVCPLFSGDLTEMRIAHRTEHDHGQVGRLRVGPHPTENLQTINPRHHDIKDDQIGTMGRQIFQRLGTTLDKGGIVSDMPDEQCQQPPRSQIIIDD